MVEYNNAYGTQQVFDGGNPRTITIKARCNISGGYWVNGSSAQGVVSSGTDSYATTEIEGFTVATQIGSQVIGLALTDIASGTTGVVARRGDYILPLLSGTAIGSAYSGQKFAAGSAGTIVPLISGLAWNAAAAGFVDFSIGTIMTQATCAAGTQYCIVTLNI